MSEHIDGRPRVHTFEAAGLGVAPFTIVGFGEKGSCRFCGRGLNTHALVQDSKGVRFRVGEDCALRTGDEALVLAVQKGRKARARDSRRAKKDAEEEKERARLYGYATRIAEKFGLKGPVRPVADVSKWEVRERYLRVACEQTEEQIAEERAEFTAEAEAKALHGAAVALEQWMRNHARSGKPTPLSEALRALGAEVRAFRLATEFRPYG